MIDAKIVDIDVKDIRFPTSLWKLGSDAMHVDPDHSCVYVTIKTDKGYEGYGISCTLGNGNALVVEMCKILSELVKNRTTTEIFNNFASFWRILTSDTQLRWIGPECGVIHLATAAIVNALWDLWARMEDKPVWKLLTDMTPEQLVSIVDFRYMRNVIDEQEAIQMLKKKQPNRKKQEERLQKFGYPAYAADVGCRGYPIRKMQDLCKKYAKLEFKMFKVSAAPDLEENVNKCHILHQTIGRKKKLLLDVSQIWDYEDYSDNKENDYMKMLAKIKPFCIEDPIFPDDPLMYRFIHSDIRDKKDTQKIKVSCGKACANRVMFKQFKIICGANFWHVNVAKLGGVNEALAVYFLALSLKERKIRQTPVWAHTGGIGLGEMAQHLQMWDYICLSQKHEARSIEFVNHQHGYFENPVFIKNARYMPPTRPGFSTKLKEKCIARWSYPEGTRWKYLFKTKKQFVNETEDENERGTEDEREAGAERESNSSEEPGTF